MKPAKKPSNNTSPWLTNRYSHKGKETVQNTLAFADRGKYQEKNIAQLNSLSAQEPLVLRNIPFWTRALARVNLKDPQAQLIIGLRYLLGKGSGVTQPNHNKAAKTLLQLIKEIPQFKPSIKIRSIHSMALFALGYLHTHSTQLTVRNDKQGKEYLERATKINITNGAPFTSALLSAHILEKEGDFHAASTMFIKAYELFKIINMQAESKGRTIINDETETRDLSVAVRLILKNLEQKVEQAYAERFGKEEEDEEIIHDDGDSKASPESISKPSLASRVFSKIPTVKQTVNTLDSALSGKKENYTKEIDSLKGIINFYRQTFNDSDLNTYDALEHIKTLFVKLLLSLDKESPHPIKYKSLVAITKQTIELLESLILVHLGKEKGAIFIQELKKPQERVEREYDSGFNPRSLYVGNESDGIEYLHEVVNEEESEEEEDEEELGRKRRKGKEKNSEENIKEREKRHEVRTSSFHFLQ